jgi:hypothetical protein
MNILIEEPFNREKHLPALAQAIKSLKVESIQVRFGSHPGLIFTIKPQQKCSIGFNSGVTVEDFADEIERIENFLKELPEGL